jgi:hypothetical protein
MKRLVSFLSAVVAASVLAGCMPVGHGGIGAPTMGVLYTEVWGAGMAGDRVGAKEGTACVQSVLGLVATGDSSIRAAAKSGGITKIDSVDFYVRNIVGVLAEYCTIVRGS